MRDDPRSSMRNCREFAEPRDCKRIQSLTPNRAAAPTARRSRAPEKLAGADLASWLPANTPRPFAFFHLFSPRSNAPARRHTGTHGRCFEVRGSSERRLKVEVGGMKGVGDKARADRIQPI